MNADSSPKGITASRDSDIFPFFDLPSELRNDIYSRLTHDVELCTGRSRFGGLGFPRSLAVTVRNAPLRNAKLISNKFKDEYEDQITKRTPQQIVEIKEIGGSTDIEPKAWKTLENLQPPMKRIDLHLIAYHGIRDEDLSIRTIQIGAAAYRVKQLGLPIVPGMSVDISLFLHSDVALRSKSSWATLEHAALHARLRESTEKVIHSMPAVKSLRVYHLSSARKDAGRALRYNVYENIDGLLATWTEKDGWEEC